MIRFNLVIYDVERVARGEFGKVNWTSQGKVNAAN